jgi:hypothetical protein
MRNTCVTFIAASATALLCGVAAAAPVYQPPGANLTYGDVTHGLRVQSASSNPAAAAADRTRQEGQSTRGTVFSVAAGLEYGNLQELFDVYNEIAAGYRRSNPGTGSKPDDGINIGKIIDAIDPDLGAAIDAIGAEITTQLALQALMATEGYGKAWVSADLPLVLGGDFLGGTWTTGVNWSGGSKAFGVPVPLEFDIDQALMDLEDWAIENVGNLVGPVDLSGDVQLQIDPTSRNVLVILDNDSSLLTKASQLTEFNLGYSRESLTNDSGRLYLGVEAKLYQMRLSRLSARLGDITDSQELFDAIDNGDFNNDTDFGVDIGALWVGRNYQIGAQWTNINEPTFEYPDVDVSQYRNQEIVDFLQSDKRYTMDSQVKLEASFFSSDRRWSAHLGYDADETKDPFGDEYQWATLSAALARPESFWLPNFRVGYRQNLAGTELGYVSVGLTAFKYVNFDIASALDTVYIDGTKLPQGLMGSIGFQIAW